MFCERRSLYILRAALHLPCVLVRRRTSQSAQSVPAHQRVHAAASFLAGLADRLLGRQELRTAESSARGQALRRERISSIDDANIHLGRFAD
jgi:hypothetical protein